MKKPKLLAHSRLTQTFLPGLLSIKDIISKTGNYSKGFSWYNMKEKVNILRDISSKVVSQEAYNYEKPY